MAVWAHLDHLWALNNKTDRSTFQVHNLNQFYQLIKLKINYTEEIIKTIINAKRQAMEEEQEQDSGEIYINLSMKETNKNKLTRMIMIIL